VHGQQRLLTNAYAMTELFFALAVCALLAGAGYAASVITAAPAAACLGNGNC
jgi:hypothetical protein